MFEIGQFNEVLRLEGFAVSATCITINADLISEASSRDPFAFSTLRQPRCMKLMALVCLMVTL